MKGRKSELERLKRELQSLESQEQEVEIPEDPVEFAKALFKFTPTRYQAKLLRDTSKRIVVKWSRQAGKTTTIALRAIWYAVTHPKTLTLIVAPSLRQSMIMSDRVHDHLAILSKDVFKRLVEKLQRTVITFKNGSRIIALPNSPHLLRGYTSHQVICDEAAFFKDDALVFYNILYPMLATTDGVLIASSTPWNRDSVFYSFCQSPEFSKHFITWRDVVEAGLVKESFIAEMREQLPLEQFQREFEAQFVEDADAWLPQGLIASCIDAELEPYSFHDEPEGAFFLGVDFGKHQDYSVVVACERRGDTLYIVHVHKFPLKTEYASVIGYIKSLHDRWRTVHAVYADVTGVGDYIVEDMRKAGITTTTGITFTVKSKEEMANILREKMRDKTLKIPYSPRKSLLDVDLPSELNVERFELSKTGHIQFSHPQGTHDDVFWATALAVYAAVKGKVKGIVDFGKIYP